MVGCAPLRNIYGVFVQLAGTLLLNRLEIHPFSIRIFSLSWSSELEGLAARVLFPAAPTLGVGTCVSVYCLIEEHSTQPAGLSNAPAPHPKAKSARTSEWGNDMDFAGEVVRMRVGPNSHGWCP